MPLIPYRLLASTMTECACASLIFVSFTDVPSLVCVNPSYWNGSTSSRGSPVIHIFVDGLGLMLLTRILTVVAVDFHAVTSSSFLQSFNELLEFFFTASQQIER